MASLVNGLGGSSGFGENSMARNDDSPSQFINLSTVFAGGLNFFGNTYTGLYLNYNGSVSFGTDITTFSPSTITGKGARIIAPFWGDVDIRNTKDPTPGSNLIWWDLDPATKTFTATWDDVGYYSQHNDKTNAFQLRLVGKDEPGDFDIYFYYESIGWLTGDASGGKNGTGGDMAHAGYSSGNGKNFFEIEESGTTGMFGLPGLSNIGQGGVYLFEVRNGAVPLFTSAANAVNYNNLTEDQKDSVAAGNDLYHGKGGSDTVTLPDPANYNQVVGKDKDGNDIRLNWQDTATFFTESRAGDTYLVDARAGNHVIVAGAGNDAVTINGNGNNTITTGSGETTVVIASGGGNNEILGGTGKATINIDTTGSGKNTITGGGGTTSIKLKMVGAGENKIQGGSGTTTIEIDSASGTGDNEIKTGFGVADTNITITAGKGLNEITADGLGDLTVTIKTTGGNDSNAIMLGAGSATIDFKGTITLANTGDQSVTAGAGHAKVSFEGNYDHATVIGSATPTAPAIFDVFKIKDSSSTVTLLDRATISSLHLAKDATLSIGAGAKVKITDVKNGEGRPIDPGTISIGQNATLELETPSEGKVNLGTGSSTLVLPSLGGVSYNPTNATAGDIDFHIGALKIGDSIVVKGMNVTTQQVVMAGLGNLKLSDGSTQLTLQVNHKSFLSSSPTFGAYIAVDSIVGVSTLKNSVYVDVTQSANGDDTILTLKSGNNFDTVLNGPEARAQHGVTGSGIKIGIISDTFDFADPAGAARDLNSGAVPVVNVISDPGVAFLFGKDEGRAMAQIIHAIAPGATLYFSSPGRLGGVGLGSAINDLHAAGVDIIVDDLGVPRLNEFLSGVSSAIDSAVRSGITYVSSAGNNRLGDEGFFFSRAVSGHSAKPNVISVAAMNVLATPSVAQPDGRYLGAVTESFSSKGTNGKPDLTGPDGGQTTFNLLSGFNAFSGTSASAPAVAAVAGLMMQANPLLTARPKEVMDILKATALSFGESPSSAGTGFVQADKAVAQAIAAKDAFFNAPGNAPADASFSVSATAAGPQVSSAALSVAVGSASTGQTVLLMVELSGGVIVTGAPSFTLNTGGLFTYNAGLSTPSAGRLLFEYTVGSVEQASHLALTGFIGTVKDTSGNDADFSALFGQQTGLTINSPLTVSGIASSKTGVVMAGETIELTVTLAHGAALAGAGSPTLALSHGATATFDAASSNLAIGKLVFDYKVAAGEATSSLTIASIDLPRGTTITDASGNHADFLQAIDHTMGVQIGPAFVAGLFPATEQTAVTPGQTMPLTLFVSQGVVVDTTKGNPTLALSSGAIATYDAAASDPSKGQLVFDYKSSAGEPTGNLLVTKVELNGATIKDSSGIVVDLTGAQNAPLALTVGSPLTVVSVQPSKTGLLNLGDSAHITITMSAGLTLQGVTSGGPPTLTLSDGGIAVYDTLLSDPGAGTLVFDYTVMGSAHPVANLAVQQFDQNGAVLYDSKGNFADMSGALAAPLGLQVTVPDPATAIIAATAAVKAEGNSGTTAFTFTVTLDKALGTSASVDWVVTGSGADPAFAGDFAGGVLPAGTLSFAAGETTKTITVNVQGDTTIENDETFGVTLLRPAGSLVIGTAGASGTILNDEATLSIAATGASKAEGNAGTTVFTFTLTRGGDTSAGKSVAWSVAGAGANPANAADFAGGILPSGGVTFAAGETTKTIAINVQGDTTIESDEIFLVTLANASAGLTVTTATAGGTIQNDDTSVSIAASDATKAEGNAGTTAFTFTLTRSGDTSGMQSVAWSSAGSGAAPANAADFAGGVLPAGSVTFAASETVKTIVVNVQGDTVGEGNEGFTVTLANPSTGLTLGTASATGTIQSDDTAVSIAAANANKAEGNSGATAFTFTLTRSGDNSSVQSVAWSVAGSGASPANAADFAGGTLPGGAVTFAVGETAKTVTVNVQGDTQGESNEDFTVTLANASAGLAIGTASATGTIQDDDTSVSIAATSASKAEGNSGTTAFTFTVTRSGSTSAVQSVAWSVAGSGASPATASDFAGNLLPTGSVTFGVGETAKTVTVNVQGDITSEPNEGFAVTLANASAGLIIATASATGTIQNDDAGPLTVHDDAYVALRGSTIVVNAANGVLFNDDGSGLTASLKTAPSVGGLQLAADGSFTYTPLFGFAGIVTFAYHATSAGNSADGDAVLFVVPTVASPSSTTLDLLSLSSEQQIAATYAAFFGRAADAGGFGFWVGEFNRLLPVQGPAALFANIASSFGISDEAEALYPFLANPFGASDAQISAFIDSVYNNLFNRSSDAGGLGYWTGEIRNALANNLFVGSVLVNIMSGAQDTAAGKDISTLMAKVAVSIDYVHEQLEHNTHWVDASDIPAATNLLHAVTATPQSILTGIKTAETLIANHA